jgi:hypothetical protein
MSRVAVLDPDDDPHHGTPFASTRAAREALIADLTGRRLEVRQLHGELMARITPDRSRLSRVLAWMRGRLPR